MSGAGPRHIGLEDGAVRSLLRFDALLFFAGSARSRGLDLLERRIIQIPFDALAIEGASVAWVQCSVQSDATRQIRIRDKQAAKRYGVGIGFL